MFVCSECGAPQPTEGRCPLDGHPLTAIGEDVLLGTTIGAYRVARLLGIGGMGRVYKGVHPQIGSRVAIKVLSRECTDRRDLVERFFAEARAVNLIRHESIVNVLDLSVLPDGRPYIVMEYLDGAPLGAILDHAQTQNVPLPLGGLARLTVEVLDALGAAHAKGIVHRDLKPDNIFVTPSGRPKVLDFGIARFTEPGSGGGSTRTGSLLGTPHYMSPEQAAGRPVDHRADLYAIGVILFECATGVKPFRAEALFDLLRQHVEQPPPSPRSLRPDLDPGFEHVILCALAKAPEQRFATAQAMSIALQQATAHLAAEHWSPITGSGTQRVPSGVWQPTPPSSWGSRAHPRPSEQPIFEPPANVPVHRQMAQQSTVSASAGQLQKQPPQRSRSKLGLIIGAVALVGAAVGITIAAQRSGSDSPTVAASDPGSASPTAPSPTDPVTPSTPTQPTQPTPSQPPPTQPTPAKPAGPGSAAAPSPTNSGEDDVHANTKGLPDDVRKRVEDATRDAARAAKEIEKAARSHQGSAKVEAGDEDDDPPPSPSKKAGPWLENHTITPPNWNPGRVNVAQFIQFALAEARKAVPDAQLTRIEVNGVTPDGFANLSLPTLASDSGDIELRFISPSRSKRDPSIPVGVPQKRECEFRVEGEPSGVVIRPTFASDCKELTVPVPRCTATALWKLAQNHKAPSNAVATISYYRASMHPSARFFFAIGFGHDVSFSQVFTDADCP